MPVYPTLSPPALPVRLPERPAPPLRGVAAGTARMLPQAVIDAAAPDDDLAGSAAAEDDVVGNGIFDAGRVNTHLGNGLFEDAWSWPGYAARETGYGPSEVVDRHGRPEGIVDAGLLMWPGRPTDSPPPGLEPVVRYDAARGIENLRGRSPQRRGVWNRHASGVRAVSGFGDDTPAADAPDSGPGIDITMPDLGLLGWGLLGLVIGGAVAFVTEKR